MKSLYLRIGIIIITLLSVWGCSQADRYAHFLNEQLRKHYATEAEEYEFIVIMPRRGCHSCIHSSEEFYFHTKDDERFLFIFTRIDSTKKLGLEIGKENLSATNVKLDTNNLFFSSKYYDSNYPLLLHKSKDGSFTYQKLVSN